jgi:predicted alpha/beta superfamily hydrolase
MRPIEKQPPLSAMLPATRYYEVQSARVGASFAVWITLPPRYDQEPNARYPAIYQPDGNLSTPLTAPAAALLRDDPINPIVPHIQVNVGYIGEEASRALAVRARDLLPPQEPLPEGLNESSMQALVQAGLLDQTGAELYLRNLRNPAADRFLAFLTEELHPWVSAEFRVDTAASGLFGYSYGGLFATYAALRRTPFRRIGAGSPGILPRRSKVFELYRSELAQHADHSGRMLHMTVCEKEITVPSMYQGLVGAGTVEFMTLAGTQPLEGLRFSSYIQAHDSHASGFAASWFSFLRMCYSAAAPTDLLTATVVMADEP